MILSFYRTQNHFFQNLKTLGFSRHFFSDTRNLLLKLYPKLETLIKLPLQTLQIEDIICYHTCCM